MAKNIKLADILVLKYAWVESGILGFLIVLTI